MPSSQCEGRALTHLKYATRRLEVVEACSKHFGIAIVYTQSRAIRLLLLKHYTPAAKEWGPVVARYDAMEHPVVPNTVHTPEATDSLARWLDQMSMEDGEPEYPHCANPRTHGDSDEAQLYRCSNCGNPSSVLRKCSRCAKAR